MIYGVAGDQLRHLFTDNQEVIAHARSVLIWTVLAPAAASACYVLDGIFIGATHTVPMRNSMIIATFAIFFPAYYLFTSLYGVHGLWLDRKSTRLNSSHVAISYAVFCLKKKK